MTNRQFSRLTGRGTYAVVAFIGALCLVTAGLGDDARQALRYERAALQAGQWWRILSAHFVHLSTVHTLLNLTGLALVGAVFRRELRIRDWCVAGVAGAGAIAAGLYVFNMGTSWYVGLSGLLHGWFALGAAYVAERERGFGLALLGALAVKLGYEQLAGALPSTLALDPGPVVVAAHLYGALGALACYLASRWRSLVGSVQRRL